LVLLYQVVYMTMVVGFFVAPLSRKGCYFVIISTKCLLTGKKKKEKERIEKYLKQQQSKKSTNQKTIERLTPLIIGHQNKNER